MEQFERAISKYAHKEILFQQDLILIPLFLFGVYWVLRYFRKQQPTEIQKYFLPAYFIRIAGIVLFLIHHILIYQGGVDSFSYYWATNSMWEMIQINPSEVAKVLFTNSDYSSYPYTISIFFFNPNETFTVKVFSLLSFCCFNSYLLMSLVAGLFTFGGCWKIFRIFHSLYPQQAGLLAISTLFIPSVFFWSSVISKEIICIGAMGYLFHCIYYFFILKKKRLLHFIGILLFSYILIRVKLYILLAFIPSLMIFLLMTQINKMKHPLLKKLTLPFALSLLGLFLYLLLAKLGNMLTQFSLDKIIESGMITYNYLTQEGFAESRYSLGEFDPSVQGVLKLAPAGINVTLFRPYLWEVTKPITLIASIESLITLFITLIVIFRAGVIRSLHKIFSNPVILFCLTFSLIFSLAVGVTSGNFGTLMRYKIPMMPFYFTALVLIYARKKKVIRQDPDLGNADISLNL